LLASCRLYSTHPHRDLPSFPTRRSSDLPRRETTDPTSDSPPRAVFAAETRPATAPQQTPGQAATRGGGTDTPADTPCPPTREKPPPTPGHADTNRAHKWGAYWDTR